MTARGSLQRRQCRELNFMDPPVDGRMMTIRHMLTVAVAAFVLSLSVGAQTAPLVPATPSVDTKGPPNGVVELDRNGDGQIDYRVIYDQAGVVAREEMDFNFDGKMDTFYYYKSGVLQRVEIDSKNTGKIDIWVYLLDGKYVQRYERDTDGDGKPDLVRTFNGG